MVNAVPTGQVHSTFKTWKLLIFKQFLSTSFSLSNTQLCTLVGSPSESLSLGVILKSLTQQLYARTCIYVCG